MLPKWRMGDIDGRHVKGFLGDGILEQLLAQWRTEVIAELCGARRTWPSGALKRAYIYIYCLHISPSTQRHRSFATRCPRPFK